MTSNDFTSDFWVLDVEGQTRSPVATHQHQDKCYNHMYNEPSTSSQQHSEFESNRSLQPWKCLSRAVDSNDRDQPKTLSQQMQNVWHRLFKSGREASRVLNESQPTTSEKDKRSKENPKAVVLENARMAFSNTSTNTLKHAGQGLFICIDHGRHGQLALQVPCFRPTDHRHPTLTIERKLKNGHKTRRYRWKKVPLTERACESDDQIVQRMKEKLEGELGLWAKFVPYYGVLRVDIVDFRFLPGYPRHDRLPITMKQQGNGPPISEMALRRYNNMIQLSQEIASDEHGCGPCTQPLHLPKCPASKDPLLPCMALEPRQIGKRRGIRETCRIIGYHNGEFCDYSETCIEQQAERAARVGIPGVEAFKRLPEWLRRPRDVSGWPLSRWMKQEHLLYNLSGLERIMIPSDAKAYDARDSFRGIKFELGWDFDRMRLHMPCHLALSLIAGSIVWLCVILWATETDDNSTALAFGSVLVGFFTLLLSNGPTLVGN